MLTADRWWTPSVNQLYFSGPNIRVPELNLDIQTGPYFKDKHRTFLFYIINWLVQRRLLRQEVLNLVNIRELDYSRQIHDGSGYTIGGSKSRNGGS